MCIVVVDDEPELLELLRGVLQSEGYEVLSFTRPSPVTTLKETAEHPDVFLIDLMLPEMDGIALAARLKDEGFETTPKIAMSASREWLRAAEESHLFQLTLNKPFDVDELLTCVGQFVAA